MSSNINNGLKKLRNIIEWIGQKIFWIIYYIFPKDKIVVWDSHGASFSKYTFLKQKVLIGKTKLIIPKPKSISLSYLLTLARAKIFVTNTNTKCTKLLQDIGHGKTIVVNIWHGAGYFKKFGKDENNIGMIEYRHKYGKPDYVICSSEEICSKIADIFTVRVNKVLPLGNARSDLLFDRDYIKESREKFFLKYPNLVGKKIYLFAPTWRGTPLDGTTAYYYSKLDFNKVSILLDDEEVIIVKNHQLVIGNGNRCNINYSDKVISCDKEEIMRLIIICDVLITDYSSVYFDAITIDKPILFYAEDVDEYTRINKLYDNYENFCPGKILMKPDPQRFVDAVRESKNYVKTEKYQIIKNKFVGRCDGYSSQRLANFLLSLFKT